MPANFFEQDALAFHHRLGCQRADIAQTQHRSTITDDRHQIAARGVLEGIGRIGHDFFAGSRHTRRICQREIALIGQQFGRRDTDLAGRRKLMVFQRCLTKLLTHFFFLGDHRIHTLRSLFLT